MRSLVTSLTVCFLLVFSLVAFGQNPPAAPPGAQAPAQQERPQAAEKTYSGTLSKVDLTAKEITVKGADNKDMVFTFNDKTQMSGIENQQGLSGKTGSNLRVTYQEGRANVATKIEVAAAQKDN
jgi:Cu/Ag efflux protein CusF